MAVALVLLGLQFYQRGELFPIILLICGGGAVAFLSLGALLYFIGRWLGQQEDE